MISAWLWGRDGRKRLVDSNDRFEAATKTMSERVAALEAEARVSSMNVVQYYHTGETVAERKRHLQNAVDAAATRGIKEAVERLPPTPLAGGHAYVSLPDGTNIALMSDGTMRLALPVSISASSGEVRLGDTERSDDR